MKSWLLRMALTLFMSILFSACQRADQETQETDQVSSLWNTKPNIVLIFIDDLGYKDVGFTGDTFYETPNIDKLASEGMIFNRAYSGGPNCAPSRATLISGMYPPRHQIYTPGGKSKSTPYDAPLWVPLQDRYIAKTSISVDEYENQYKSEGLNLFSTAKSLPPDLLSIAAVLENAEYITGRFGKWHVGPHTLGFSVSSPDGKNMVGNGEADIGNEEYNNPDSSVSLTRASVEFIRNNKDRPFFLYLSHWEVHAPYIAEPVVIENYEKKKAALEENDPDYVSTYAAMIEAVDKSVGQIMQTLKQVEIDRTTLVIFTSDNGGIGPSFNQPLRSVKGSLYEGGIRVPTVMRWPGVIGAGTSSKVPIGNVDFLPTFATLAGVKIKELPLPAYQAVDGRDISVEFQQQRRLNHRYIYFHYPLYLEDEQRHDGPMPGFRAIPASAVIKGKWKMIEYFVPDRELVSNAVGNQIELYNLEADIGEATNLANDIQHRDIEIQNVYRELRQNLREWRRDVRAPVPLRTNKYYRKVGSQ